MKLLKFYFGTKVGLQSPSQTLRKLSDILCWILNISGMILSCFILLTQIGMLPYIKAASGVLSTVCIGIVLAILNLVIWKIMSWLCAFGLECKVIHLEAHEKILKWDFEKLSKEE